MLAKERFNLRARDVGATDTHGQMEFVPFSASTRMSGVNVDGTECRKGAGDAIARWVGDNGGTIPRDMNAIVERIAREGGTPLVVAERMDGVTRVLGAIYLKDIVKGGMRERFTTGFARWASAP